LDDISATLQLHPDELPRRSNSPARNKSLPPIPRAFGGGAATLQQQQLEKSTIARRPRAWGRTRSRPGLS
jgi:hypothetical protein